MTEHNSDTVRASWALYKVGKDYHLTRVVYDRELWWELWTDYENLSANQRTARQMLKQQSYSVMDGYFEAIVPLNDAKTQGTCRYVPPA